MRIAFQRAVGTRKRIGLLVTIIAVFVAVGAALFFSPPPPSPAERMDAWAARYVSMALSLAHIDSKEVDSYYGPPELDARSRSGTMSVDELRADASKLLDELESDRKQEDLPRRERLHARVARFVALLEIIEAPNALSFDQEARRVYGLVANVENGNQRQLAVVQLEALLPGDGTLASRADSFRNRFVVPAEKREAVFNRALGECRTRTLAHWSLPKDEKVEVEWSDAVPAASHQYHGGYRSTLKINPLSVAFVGSAVDVACHEGYPGHHTQFLVMEAASGKRGLPIEDTVVLSRSPESMLREGAANYGIDLAFPLEDRVVFERDVLFPLAGFPPELAEKYVRVHHLISELALSVMPILSSYRDGSIGFDAAARALEDEALISSPQALLRFVDQVGAYAAGYTVARDQIHNYVEARSGGRPSGQWRVLRNILSNVDVSALGQQSPAARVFPLPRPQRGLSHDPA